MVKKRSVRSSGPPPQYTLRLIGGYGCKDVDYPFVGHTEELNRSLASLSKRYSTCRHIQLNHQRSIRLPLPGRRLNRQAPYVSALMCHSIPKGDLCILRLGEEIPRYSYQSEYPFELTVALRQFARRDVIDV